MQLFLKALAMLNVKLIDCILLILDQTDRDRPAMQISWLCGVGHWWSLL